MKSENNTPFEIVYVHVPCGTRNNAVSIAEAAIQERLASCTHIIDANSCYEWNSELQNENEYLVILKTLPEAVSTLQSLIEERHEYDLPCILAIKAVVNESYYDWMKKQIRIPRISA